ncbi:hypothetical protein D9M71_424220 [compost metagenome]
MADAGGDGRFVEQVELGAKGAGDGEGVAIVEADAAAEGVRQGRHFLHFHRVAGGQAGVHGGAAAHADAVQADARVGVFHGQGHAGEQAAAGQRHQHLAHFGQLLEDFQAEAALAGDDVGVVEGRQQGGALFTGDALGFGLGVVLAVADDHHAGTEVADRLHLVLRYQVREADSGLHALGGSGMGEGAAVIAGGGRHHAPRLLRLVEQGYGVARTTQLEAAGDLLGFELEVDRHAKTR